MQIAYVGPFLSGRDGSAAFQRAMGVSAALADAGNAVTIGVAEQDVEVDRLALHPGVTVEATGERSRSAGRTGRGLEWIRAGHRTGAWLSGLERPPQAVIVYGGGARYASTILGWCRENSAASVVDCVEWYDPTHQPLGPRGPFARDHERAMRTVYAQAGNLICISTLLEHHFTRLGCRTLLVPPTTDVLSMPWSKGSQHQRLRLAYAGTPGRKDHLAVVIEGMWMARQGSGLKLTLDVVGPSHSEVAALADGSLPPWLRVHGKKSRDEALRIVRAADFTVLVRPDALYANAGFPTKVVESLASGTPVICNITSDLGQHIRDGETGVLISELTPSGVADALERAKAAKADHGAGLRDAARREAETAFDYRAHVQRIESFISSAAQDAPRQP